MEYPPTASPQKMANDKEKLLGAISYLGPLWIISFFMAEKSHFVIFHAKQGLALFLVSVVLHFGIRFLASPLGSSMHSLASLVSLLVLILAIAGIVKAVQGEQWEMPVIGALAKKFTF